MKYQVNKAVVVGAGTMGAALAAHFANAGISTTLLDIVPFKLTEKEEKKGLSREDKAVRYRIVNDGLVAAKKSRPASFFSSDQHDLVNIGNLEDDFDVIADADIVVEAIIENLEIKQDLMKRIDAIRKPTAIIATNTSGIPVKAIAEGLSDGFKQHFLGMHFFNPPRYLKLLEVIPTADTLPEVVEFVSRFGEYRLGKGIVLCKDTPNFIGNRLAFGTGAFALDYILKNDLTIEEVDMVTGPIIGRPKTATFRLIDLVGIDVWDHVGRNLTPLIQHDTYALPYLEAEAPNALIADMVKRGWLGNKTRGGFYNVKKDAAGKKTFLHLDFKTMEYLEPSKPRFDSVGAAKKADGLKGSIQAMLDGDDKAAKLVQALVYQGSQYASVLIPEVADTMKPIDDAMRWGFGHKVGPFEVWDMLGVQAVVDQMTAAGFAPADWVLSMLKSGNDSFYQYEDGNIVGVYDVSKQDYVRIARTPGLVLLREQKVVKKNAGATLYDMGDGVACVEFHTKMNALDADIVEMINEGIDRTESDFDGLVIGHEADHFSAGANLFMVVMAAQQQMWDQLDEMIVDLQNMMMRMRYSPKPVVVAPAGMALGGGCEVTMHGSRVVAAGELYIGLVELGAGVIPAGGGTKEMMRRIVNPAMKAPEVVALPFVQKAFLQIGQAKVATSAREAQQMGILSSSDRIVMSRDHLLAEAKKEVLHMANTGYTPPLPEKIYAAGRDMLGALELGAYMFKEGNFITEYENVIANKLSYILSGGGLSKPQWVSEQYVLDLEREAFLSLCGEAKTQERMWALLITGKPLRN
ncbi:MAG: 3-hydroxyacyl-CoA dehydrogenase/enoyl-CoA hydratase family protein [Anaerolineae bacterium]|jgi:3-hydroxyacyl-CoA dehydrogenase|nr:3-hydroxyacyl-CoA dehydrogenase/enoyl-CoA hydratase family protein [Anaerolineae bacterium]MBT7069971.1 3-hydroxyacyl-CoA dehydrogenase/enoyl-CoA hydratase family protein [Anaerolineae bacterium]MBT7324929.1 3-hydroxyacyl-CoA dehydrogenase/enoyl-CoA hydratase family protein [Anaerolineae bacterium]